jgi:hypothetical protein
MADPGDVRSDVAAFFMLPAKIKRPLVFLPISTSPG